MNPFYVTREAVKLAGNINGPSEHSRLDRIIAARTDSIERWLGRHFYPRIETRLFDWPSTDQTPYQLLLNADLLEIIDLDAAGIDILHFFGYPQSGPPFSRIEIDLAFGESFTAGGSWQNQVSVEAIWGYSRDLDDAGALVGTINDTVKTLDVSNSALVGVGDLLKIASEYLIVTRRSLKSISTLTAGFDGEENTRLVPVVDGTLFHVDELITIDAERLLIEDIAGNNLICQRQQDASLLAAHLTAAPVYAARTLIVERGAVGTTAAAHLDALAVQRNRPPGLITELAVAEVLATREQELHGYGREIGQGDGAFELRGIGVASLRKKVEALYSRSGGSRKAAI